jgi:foldase protein PrsA
MLHHNRMPYRRLALFMLAAVMLVAILSGCGKKAGDMPGAGTGKVIATYNGGEVTETEFDKYVAYTPFVNQQKAMYMSIPQFKEENLKEYIVSKVLVKNVSKKDLDAAKTAAADFQKQLEDAVKTQAQIKDYMDKNNLTVADVVAFFQHDQAIQSYYTAKGEELKPKVTEEEIKAQYTKNPSDFNVITVRHILIGTVDPNTQAELKSDADALKLAKEVKVKLDAGGDWNALAKQYSTDTGSKDKGGLYEKQKAYGWVAEFKDAVNKQEIGKIGDPVRSQFGYHIIKVESREPTAYDKLVTADKDKLRVDVATTKLTDFIKAEQDKLAIKVTLPAVPSPSASPSTSPSASPSTSPSASPSPSPSPSASAK